MATETVKIHAVRSGRTIFPMCSADCRDKMIAMNPPGTTEATTVDRKKSHQICSMCYGNLKDAK